jgi:acyl-CoA ligase (AMP-forming) (exosortase A-associated)
MSDNLIHFLRAWATEHPGKTAIASEKDRYGYLQLLESSSKAASFLSKSLPGRSNKVVIYLNKSFEQIASLSGCMMSGNVFVLVNPISSAEQVTHILKDSEASILITDGRKYGDLKNAHPELDISALIVGPHDESKAEGIASWDEVTSPESPFFDTVSVSGSDTACLIYTSGSTGRPKGIIVSHSNLFEGARIVCDYLNIQKEDRIILPIPLNFDYGLNQLANVLLKGATLFLHDYHLPNDLLKTLEEEEITGLPGMLPIWSSIFNSRLTAEVHYKFESLRFITNTGNKIPARLVKKMRGFFPDTSIYLMYGFTEAFRSTYLPPKEADRIPDSIGKAVPGVEILVLDKNGMPCPPGKAGELVHRGGVVTQGYWKDPELTESKFRPNPLSPESGEKVVYSGDSVYADGDGYLYFVGRKDDMIKTSGYRVSPTEAEEIAVQHPSISDCVCFGIEDEDIGEKICLVYTTANSTESDAGEIRNFCRKKAPHYLVPHHVIFRKEFPLTGSGKIDRMRIKKEARSKLLGQEATSSDGHLTKS